MKRQRSYGSKQPSRAQHRAALLAVLTGREKPLTDADKASLARSFGATVAEVEQVAAQVAQRRAG